jgi:cell wall-associated NlpC family hydrolase
MSLPAPEALGVDTSLPDAGLDGVTMASPGLAAPVPGEPSVGDTLDAGAAYGDSTAPVGAVQNAPIGGGRDRVVQFAKRFLGDPYVWGGTKPGGFDCSGLVQYVMKQAAGVDLPRISYEQANYGKRVAVGALQPGDLVAWDENARNPGADHIAIYAGNGMIIEAPHAGARVRLRKLGANEGAWGVQLNYGVHTDARRPF